MSSVDDSRHRPHDDIPPEGGAADEPASLQEQADDAARQIEAGPLHDRRGTADRRSGERRRRRLWNLFFLFATVVAVLLAVPRYLVDTDDALVEIPPDELAGTWTTDAPRYAGRLIRIGPDRLTLGLGPEGQRTYAVQSIRVEAAEVHRRYEIRYEGDSGDEERLDVFIYDDGLMRLKNPSEVQWTRRSD